MVKCKKSSRHREDSLKQQGDEKGKDTLNELSISLVENFRTSGKGLLMKWFTPIKKEVAVISMFLSVPAARNWDFCNTDMSKTPNNQSNGQTIQETQYSKII